jgi:hypothetical protein
VIDKPLPRYLDVLLPDAVAGTNLWFLLAAAVLQVLVVGVHVPAARHALLALT